VTADMGFINELQMPYGICHELIQPIYQLSPMLLPIYYTYHCWKNKTV